MWLDTSLLFIGIVALLNTVIDFFNSTTTSSGLLSLLALGFGGGAAMYATYHFIYRHSGKPKSERPGWTKTILVAWFGNAWLGPPLHWNSILASSYQPTITSHRYVNHWCSCTSWTSFPSKEI